MHSSGHKPTSTTARINSVATLPFSPPLGARRTPRPNQPGVASHMRVPAGRPPAGAPRRGLGIREWPGRGRALSYKRSASLLTHTTHAVVVAERSNRSEAAATGSQFGTCTFAGLSQLSCSPLPLTSWEPFGNLPSTFRGGAITAYTLWIS